MSPPLDQQLTDALLHGLDLQGALTLADRAAASVREDWKRLGYGPLLAFVLWGLLRPSGPSVRPQTTTRVDARRSSPEQTDARGGSDKAIRVRSRKEPPPKVWTVPGLVPHGPRPRLRPRFGVPPWGWERRGYITCVLGSGGTGKSYVLLDLALAALTGQPWLGRPVRAARAVLYVDTELDEEECARRAHPLARGRGLPHPPGGLHYLYLHHSLASPEGQAVVARAAHRAGAELVLVDSMTIGSFDVAASDQNGWNRVYTGMERWGVPVVCIDHLDKAGKGAFGSMMKQAKIRSMLQLTRLRDGSIKVEQTKSNFGPKAEPFPVYASFGEGPGAATTFTTARPSADGQTDAAPHAKAGPEAGLAPRHRSDGGGTPEATTPAPLVLLPRRVGRDALCNEILGFLKTAPPPAPWTRPTLRDAILAARICNRGTAYAHLGHLLEDARLVEDAGTLRLAEDAPEKEVQAG